MNFLSVHGLICETHNHMIEQVRINIFRTAILYGLVRQNIYCECNFYECKSVTIFMYIPTSITNNDQIKLNLNFYVYSYFYYSDLIMIKLNYVSMNISPRCSAGPILVQVRRVIDLVWF